MRRLALSLVMLIPLTAPVAAQRPMPMPAPMPAPTTPAPMPMPAPMPSLAPAPPPPQMATPMPMPTMPVPTPLTSATVADTQCPTDTLTMAQIGALESGDIHRGNFNECVATLGLYGMSRLSACRACAEQ
jgi:hypothetical protein